MTKAQKIAVGGAGILLLGALAVYALQDGEDQPPIIVENGSVILTARKGTSEWREHRDRRFEQHHPRGRNVRGFTATSGSCTTSGDSIIITTSGGTITVYRHSVFPVFWKHHADVSFEVAGDLSVAPNERAILTLDADVTLDSFANSSGVSCQVTDGRIEIQQTH